MNAIDNHQFVILGLGSIGKRHAEFLSTYNGELICIDPNKDARAWAKKEFVNSATVYSSIKEASEKISNSTLKKIGVVSNWGTLHYESTIDLISLGVKNIYVEKPIANSLNYIDNLKNIDQEIKIIGGFQNRYTKIHENVRKIGHEKLGGSPSLMVVNGGAAGMITNGIHYLDLSISIFDAYPISVLSDLNSSNINPRSKTLDYWEGTACWDFGENRSLSINFTNSSSVRQSTEIFFPNGKIRVNEDMSIDVFERNKEEILADSRVIRLGNATKTNINPLMPDNNKLFTRVFEPFFEEGMNIDRERELIATEAMIYALIANRKEKKLFLDSKIEKDLYKYQWQIS